MIYICGMENCLQCSEPLKHVPGRKEKSFCNVNCRNKYFYAQRKKQIQEAAALLVSLPADYVEIKKVAILTKEGKVKPVFPKPIKKPKIKSSEGLSSPIVFQKEGDGEAYNAPVPKPRGLDELRKLMPPGLDALERGIWMSTERQKYGI